MSQDNVYRSLESLGVNGYIFFNVSDIRVELFTNFGQEIQKNATGTFHGDKQNMQTL